MGGILKRLIKTLQCKFKIVQTVTFQPIIVIHESCNVVFSWIVQRKISASRLALVGMASGGRPQLGLSFV